MQEVRVVIIINKKMKGRISIVFIRNMCYYNKVKRRWNIRFRPLNYQVGRDKKHKLTMMT